VLQTAPQSAVVSVLADRPARRLVVKLVGRSEQPRLDLERTAAVMAQARLAGVQVAEVLAADASGRLDGWQYLVLGHVTGVPWREVRPGLDGAELAHAHGQIATAVLGLQALRLEGFGELDRTGLPAGLDLPAALRERVRLRVRRPSALALAEELLDRTAGLFAPGAAPTLAHDDLHHANLLFAPGPGGWRLVAVLDWDKAWAGPAESDLARLAFWDDMTGPGFWSVYRDARPVVDGEDERRPVHQLLWCLEYDVGTERHRADTDALCRRLGLRPPTAG
jgi:aminoglycoside phosphotransferase (APT) family kinase protein